jgi:hypothetical protein
VAVAVAGAVAGGAAIGAVGAFAGAIGAAGAGAGGTTLYGSNSSIGWEEELVVTAPKFKFSKTK